MKKLLFGLIMSVSLTTTYSYAAKDVLKWTPVQENTTETNTKIAVVTGRGEVLPEGVRVRLVQWKDGHGDYVATDTIANGQFRLELPIEEGMTICSLMFDYYAFPSMKNELYLTPGAMVEIDAVDRYMYTWPKKSNVPEQAEYDLYVDNSKDLWIKRQIAGMEYDKSRTRDAWEECDSLSRLIYLRDLNLLKTRPVGRVWIDMAYEIASMSDVLKYDTEDLKSMYANLDDSIKNSPKGKAIYGYLYPESHIDVGDKFPDTEFHDLDGKKHNLSEFQGKWCLIDFWNSGCAPCIRALPEIRQLKKKYPETLEFISLSIDSESDWRKASETLHLTGNNWNEGKESYGLFLRIGTHSYPTFLLVSPDGTIKDIWTGFSDGSLKQKVGFHLRPKGETGYSESNGMRSILYPKYEKNNTKRVLDIDRIEMSDEGTKFFFSFVYFPKHWISISPEAYLTDSGGKKYKVIGNEGIELGKHLYADEDGNGSFSITFEAVPEDTKTVDFIESEEEWSIEGIQLKR